MPNPERPVYAQPRAIVVAVLLLHAGGLYALQSGLLRRAVQLVVPVELLSQIIEAPLPVAQPSPALPVRQPTPLPISTAAPKPTPQPVATAAAQASPQPPALPSAAQPLALPDTAPSPAAPTLASTGTGALAQSGHLADVIQAPAAAAAPPPAAPAPPAPVTTELPTSDADYLNNPPPTYPPVSRRLGEAGKVVVRVFIALDGSAQKGEVRSSSGFERLDAAALAAALKWRYVPGKRGGTPEAMWVNVPVNFTLN
jgi:periplasmic protein TonB